MSALAALAQTGANIGTAAIQNEYNKAAAERQQKWTEKNMQQAFQNQVTLDRLATPLAVQGLRDAGLSIAAMNGPMKPSGVPSAPQGAAQAVPTIEPVSIAQTRLLNAQAEKQEIENSRESSADKNSKMYVVQQMRDRIDAMRSAGVEEKDLQYLVKRTDELEASSDTFNLGNLKAFTEALNADQASFSAITSTLDNVSKQVNSIHELKNDSRLPYLLKRQKLELGAVEIALANSNIDLNDQNIEKLKEDISTLQKTRQKLDAEIEKLKSEKKLTDQQFKQLRNNDINSLLEDGDVLDAMRTYGVDNLADLLKALIFAKGLKSAGGFTAVGKSAPASVGKGSEIKFNPAQERSSLGRLAEFKLNKPSPFKYDSVDDRAYKGLAARIGENKAFEAYGDWLKNRRLGQTFNDYIYEKWLAKQHNMYDLY